MFSEHALVRVERLSKRYEIYDTPRDRLKQLLLSPLRGALRLAPKRYYTEFWALRDVSFEIAPGEAVGILGRNGSGKSTLLQLICGTLAPSGGTVQTRGRIGALLELGAGFNGDFTGRENVLLSGALLGLEPEEIEARFDEIAAFADLGPFMEHAVKTYSSGMYVRLAFAVQACVEPAILVVDEALAVGDEKFQRKCYAHIDALRERGTAILLVTHSTATIEKYCDRAILLNRGELHGIGAASQVVDQYHALLYADEQAYLRYLNSSQAAMALPAAAHDAVDAPAGVRAETAAGCEASTADIQHEPCVDSAADIGAAAGAAAAIAAARADGAAGQATAILSSWRILNADEQPCELFRVGGRAQIEFTVDVMQPVREVQAGLLIRTVEGVTAFGTSTGYHQANYFDARAGQRLRFVFDLRLHLCAGPYFITVAVAEPMGNDDMRYLDRRTDILLLRVQESAVTATGIASLPVCIKTDCLAVVA